MILSYISIGFSMEKKKKNIQRAWGTSMTMEPPPSLFLLENPQSPWVNPHVFVGYIVLHSIRINPIKIH